MKAWLRRPCMRIWLGDLTGTDGVTRRKFRDFGIVWMPKTLGWKVYWHDVAIYTFALWFVEFYVTTWIQLGRSART